MRIVACCVLLHVLSGPVPADSVRDAQVLLDGVREQMRILTSVRATYEVATTTPESTQPATAIVRYINKHDKYSALQQTTTPGADGSIERRVHDGTEVKVFSDWGDRSEPQGQVYGNENAQAYRIGDDLLAMCGFALISPAFDRLRPDLQVSFCGTETVQGRSLSKILFVAPYRERSRGYCYLWVETSGDNPRLVRDLCLVDDDPEKKVYDRRYEYDAASECPLPVKVSYERNDVGADGKVTRRFLKEARVSSLETNAQVDDGEFEFEFPVGTRVNDMVRGGITYKVGVESSVDEALEELIWTELDRPQSDAAVGQWDDAEVPAGAGGRSSDMRTDGSDTGKGITTCLFWFGLALLVIGGVLVFRSLVFRVSRRSGDTSARDPRQSI